MEPSVSSATFQVTATGRTPSSRYMRAGRQYEAVFTPGRVEFRRRDDYVETHTNIAVSSEDDLEIRRIRLINRSKSDRSLLITSYAEVVLAPILSDELHPAFSNLFVHTEIIPDTNAILTTRRPRSPGEQTPWMFCMMKMAGKAGQEEGSCSYETDRMRFIGRARNLRYPAAMENWGPLSGTTGSVLDPCIAIRREVNLAIDTSAQFDLIIGVAPTREAALVLISKYQDHRMADRVFETAATHSRAILGHLEASVSESQQYSQLASAVIFPVSTFRAPTSILRRNRKDQTSLWAYGISGDLPIVLLRVSNEDNLHLVRDMLQAHAFWRMRGLLTDLVIWNEDSSGYRRLLDDQVQALISAGTEAHLLDKPGGIFVRHIESFPEEDRVLLQAVARIVIQDVDGPLDQQLERWQHRAVTTRAAMLAPTRRISSQGKNTLPTSSQTNLIFANGTGGFTPDGREYIIDTSRNHPTPTPWVNVIANPRIGTVISESGSAYTWYGNAQRFRLTPWNNDSVSDPSGETMYIRDESSGRFFSPMAWPRHQRYPIHVSTWLRIQCFRTRRR